VLLIEAEQEGTKMAIWDFRPRGDILTGVAVGVAALAAPVVIPLVWSAVRPWLRAIIKSGFVLYETGRGAYAERRKPEKVRPSKVGPTALSAKETDQEGRVALMKRDIGELTGAGKREKPAAKKPKRQAKKGKKRPDKKV
jgi:hypothetical protein